MRPDMFKVLVERPRRGGSRAGKLRRYAMHQAMLPGGESMRQRQRTKHLNENLGPLIRFLRSRTGRPWDAVYSEICEHLRPSNTVQQHVRDHVDDFVARHLERRADGLYVTDRYEGRVDESGYRFYVDPSTGILRENTQGRRWNVRRREERAAERARIALRRRDVAPLLQLHKLRGCWYEVTLAPGEATALEPDVVHRAGLSGLDSVELYGRWPKVHAVAKRQLSRRELTTHGLAND